MIPEDEEAQLLKETQASMDALLEPSGDEEIADDARVDAELEGVV
jgi:hypothetical protein